MSYYCLFFHKFYYLLRPDHLPFLLGVFKVKFQILVTQTEIEKDRGTIIELQFPDRKLERVG